jgi:hypothetical protein
MFDDVPERDQALPGHRHGKVALGDVIDRYEVIALKNEADRSTRIWDGCG